MRSQSIMMTLISSLLFGIVSTKNVDYTFDNSTINDDNSAVIESGMISLIPDDMMASFENPLKKRSSPASPYHDLNAGALCDRTFYNLDAIHSVASVACKKLKENQDKPPPKLVGKIKACRVNVPYCNFNYPMLYKGPKGDFGQQKPLYTWPIVHSRFRKAIGSKGSDRIVIDVGARCTVYGIVRKNWFGKWRRCDQR